MGEKTSCFSKVIGETSSLLLSLNDIHMLIYHIEFIFEFLKYSL